MLISYTSQENLIDQDAVSNITFTSNIKNLALNKNFKSRFFDGIQANGLYGLDLFLNYSTSNTTGFVRNPNCWAYDVDLTCCSPWNTSSGSVHPQTLISPRHVLLATHVGSFPIGTIIKFVTKSNQVINRTVTNLMQVSGTDFSVGLLDSDIEEEEGITFAKILPDNWSDFFSKTPYFVSEDGVDTNYGFIFDPPILGIFINQDESAFVKKWTWKLHYGTGETPDLQKDIQYFGYTDSDIPSDLGGREIRFLDSGSPFFLIINNAPILLTIAYGTVYGNSVIYHKNAINEVMAQLGGGYSLTQIDLDNLPRTPLQFLQNYTKPKFAPNHRLLPLTRWGHWMPFDITKELVDHWGYAVELPGYLDQTLADQLDDPNSDISQRVAYAAANPATRPIQVLTHRPMIRGLDINFFDALPDETWLRKANGDFVLTDNTYKNWSPEAPLYIYENIGQRVAAPLQKLLTKANGAKLILVNGGEYGMVGYTKIDAYLQDPVVLDARNSQFGPEETAIIGPSKGWYAYLSRQKSRQEKIIASVIRNAVPTEQLLGYFLYNDGGSMDRGSYPEFWHWTIDHEYFQANPSSENLVDRLNVSNFPSPSLYFSEYNFGWNRKINPYTNNNGYNDLPTKSFNSITQQKEWGQDLAYNWVSGGWMFNGYLGTPPGCCLSDDDLYMGYLKLLYMSGMIGGIAGYFDNTLYQANSVTTDPPNWIKQMVILGHVHALFSYFDDYIIEGSLLSGPNNHPVSTDLPEYEFSIDNPEQDTWERNGETMFFRSRIRVLVRKKNNADQWLILAWSMDKPEYETVVTIPEIGTITIVARRSGSLYLFSKNNSRCVDLMGEPCVPDPFDPNYIPGCTCL